MLLWAQHCSNTQLLMGVNNNLKSRKTGSLLLQFFNTCHFPNPSGVFLALKHLPQLSSPNYQALNELSQVYNNKQENRITLLRAGFV